jgi:hypothetical protein
MAGFILNKGKFIMMQQFIIRYIPGGMSLNHSGFWIVDISGAYDKPIKLLAKSNY